MFLSTGSLLTYATYLHSVHSNLIYHFVIFSTFMVVTCIVVIFYSYLIYYISYSI